MKRRALGKGLSSLLPERAAASPAEGLIQVHVDRIAPNPGQPREVFDEEGLEELASSIKVAGLLQPVLVREVSDGYELVAGERRWRAARMAGMEAIPAIVQKADRERSLELALIENLQRRDLNPLEEARAFTVLMSDFGLSQEQISEKVGMTRSSVANTLRLLKLPEKIQAHIRSGRLTRGHAKALLSLTDSAALDEEAEAMIRGDVTVREAERMARDRKAAARPRAGVEERPADPNLRDAEIRLQRAMGTKVRIRHQKGGRGRIEIEFYSEEELQRLFEILEGRPT